MSRVEQLEAIIARAERQERDALWFGRVAYVAFLPQVTALPLLSWWGAPAPLNWLIPLGFGALGVVAHVGMWRAGILAWLARGEL